MIDSFLNIMRVQASMVSNGTATTTLGAIAQFDPSSYTAIVELYAADPSDAASQPVQTPWLPIFSPYVGNGWGLFIPPNIGDLVEVHYVEGSLQNGYIGMRSWQPGAGVSPLNVPLGDLWLVHQSGSYLKFISTGEVDIHVATSANINISTSGGHVNITSATQVNLTAPNVNVSGTVGLGNLVGTLLPFLNSTAATVYNSHTHSDPQGGTTGVPNQLMTSGNMSSNVTGN